MCEAAGGGRGCQEQERPLSSQDRGNQGHPLFLISRAIGRAYINADLIGDLTFLLGSHAGQRHVGPSVLVLVAKEHFFLSIYDVRRKSPVSLE